MKLLKNVSIFISPVMIIIFMLNWFDLFPCQMMMMMMMIRIYQIL
jgi:hypothetical protein